MSDTPAQRTLAAIVFTDAVSFSARMQKDEVGTLRILQRDFGEMRRICTEHEGAVLKTTGDGLLMTFSSAVHAVACALAMQRQFAAEAKDQEAKDVLLHRIGIHIGDIIVQDKDVMGDGVNIASRLQSEAEPGGICISQTVYDVVKNKIALQVVHLGPRELKNITQAIPVYRILLEAQVLQPGASNPPMAASAAGPAKAKSGNRVLLYGGIAATLAVVFIAGALVSRRGLRRNTAPATPATAPATAQSPAPAPQQSPAQASAQGEPGQAANRPGGARGGRARANVAGGNTAPAPAASSPVAATPAPATAQPDPAAEATRRQFPQPLIPYLERYDFAGLAQAIRDGGETGRGNVQLMLASAEQMIALKDWLEPTLRRYTRQSPLPVADLSGTNPLPIRVFLTADNRLVQITGTGMQPIDWSAVPPPIMASIIAAALRDARPAAPREVIQGAMAFSRMYNLPLLQTAVAALQPTGQQQPQRGRLGGGNNATQRGR
jgi:class 3 adenylate cyclase